MTYRKVSIYAFCFSAIMMICAVGVNASDPIGKLWKSGTPDYEIKGKTIVIREYWGGQSVNNMKIGFWRAQGWVMEIEGECYSTCSYLADKLPTCVRDGAKLGYHMGYNGITKEWVDIRPSYRENLVKAVEAKGGFPADHSRVTILSGDELNPFFKKCPTLGADHESR